MAEQSKNSDALWTIRTDKGKTFGPATLQTLREWARDGRVAPTSEASSDGLAWVPVTSLALEMDWIVEMAPATFYGPIHRRALDELLRDGALPAGVACFARRQGEPAALALLEAELHAARTERDAALAQSTDAERQSAAQRAALEQTRAELQARDHEFDAERQELKATCNRVQAELIKKDGKITSMQQELARLTQALDEAKTAQSRRTEVEIMLAQLQRDGAAMQSQLETLRQKLVLAEQERTAAQTQAAQERQRSEAGATQLEQARRLAQQLAETLGRDISASAAVQPEDAVIVTEPATLPPLAQPAGRKTSSSLSLADIEQQAQRELRQLGENGNTIFARQKKPRGAPSS